MGFSDEQWEDILQCPQASDRESTSLKQKGPKRKKTSGVSSPSSTKRSKGSKISSRAKATKTSSKTSGLASVCDALVSNTGEGT